ncbi:MAG: 3'-5' exoribonuclease [Fidelibacterota bacterium]|nr:MAG: 3'-5' exoribonuclease [Candidatus Neomarinimicrobiota bacterium]
MSPSNILTMLELDDFVVLDFETTGLDPMSCKIIEIGAVRFWGGEPVQEFQQLVNPQEPIPREIVDLTSITDDMVADEPTIEQVGQDLLDFIGDSALVAHNIRFDLGFLQGVYRALGLPEEVHNHLYDTMTLARTFLYHHTGFNLAALCDYYNLEHKEAHRAYNDALNTGHIFIRLVQEAAAYPLPVIQSLLGVLQHVDFPNKHLYVRLANVMSSTGHLKGINVSTVERPVPRAIFEHQGKEDEFRPQTPKAFFGEHGILAEGWDQFESRPVQVSFSDAVGKAFEDGHILIAEAGTGLGKSLAYLLPAVNHASLHQQPVVVSCHTKHLQDQLFYQEIPRLVQMLDATIKVVMLKGRGNYLCRSRLEFVTANARRLLGPGDVENILPIIIWEQFTQTGDVDECPGFNRNRGGRLWRMLRSERGFCLGNTCRRFHGCFLGPIRRAARQANLVIVNHALLIADAVGDVGLLPDEYMLVIDEAHNLPRVTTEALTMEFSEGLVRHLTDYYTRSRYRQIFRKHLRDALQVLDEDRDLYSDIQSAARRLQKKATDLLETYIAQHQIQDSTASGFRTQSARYTDPNLEFRNLDKDVQATGQALESFVQIMTDIYELLAKTDISLGESLVHEVGVDLGEAVSLRTAFEHITAAVPSDEMVLSREVQAVSEQIRVVFRCAPLMVSDFLRSTIFEHRPGTVLCSATLSAGDSFEFYRNEIGLDEEFETWPVDELEFPSPFYYDEQCVVLGWENQVDVTDQEYPRELAELIDAITDRIERRLLVLFTSYAQLRAVHEILYPRLFRTSRRLITQFGGSSRRNLLAAFKESPRAILLGTASFWEGIDLPGDLLEMLIVARLPFANPTEPVVEARIEYLREQGRNPFQEYQIPEAVTRFRQGFGRLIRTSSDEGIFIIADSRVLRRRYGQTFLDALPVATIPFSYAEQIPQLIEKVIFHPEHN